VAVASAGPYARLHSIQIDNHHSVFTGRMSFLPPNQQCQSTEGIGVLKMTHMKLHDLKQTDHVGGHEIARLRMPD